MNKLFGYGRTRTRLSLILLSALAVLCIAIVSMCVFGNLNALATDNIAYAEEPERGVVSSTGLARANYISYNWGDFWDFNYTATAIETVIYTSSDLTISVYGSGSIVGNTITFSTSSPFIIVFNFITGASKDRVALQYASAFGYSNLTSSFSVLDQRMINGSYNSTTMSAGTNYYYSVRAVNNKYLDNNSFIRWAFTPNSLPCSFDLDWVYFNNESTFSGYVSPDYQNYGYNQGYADGIANGGAGYSDISSSGVVRDNVMNNNDATVWDFDTTVSTNYANRTLFYGGNFDISFNATDAFIFNNGISSPGTSFTSLFFEPTDSFSFESSKYTFTLGFLEYHSVYDTRIQVYVNGTTITSDIFNLEEAYNGFISSTFDLSSYGGSGTPINDFVIHVIFNQLDTEQYPIDASLVRIRFIKLEQGDSFSGYVPRAYTMYGFNEAASVAYQEGYQAGLENGQLESFNYIGDLENMPSFSDSYFDLPGTTYRRLVSYAAEEDSFTYNGVRYTYQYYDTQGDDSGSVYNGLVLNYEFRYKIRIVTQFYGSASRWSQVGFKFLIIQTDNLSNYFYVSREDTNYISFLSTWTSVDNVFGDIYNVQIDIPLPDNTKTYYLAIVPIFWNYHNINADSRDLRADASWQDTSTYLIWDNTKFYGLTNQSNYQEIVNDRVHEAWSDGHYQGIQEGRAQGEQTGYTIGYNEGVNAAGNYTFMSLIGAVFDAPIGAIRGLLNFNILGVNLYDFIIALLSLAIVLFVFRVFVRGL